jgi:hypothetical protein
VHDLPAADIACWLGVQAQELSKVSQLHAEAAARDLLAAKKAEMQVLPLLTGGKNPDPAAAELVKAQAAAKCAEQLKVSDAAVAVDDVCSTYRLVKLSAELLVVLAVLLQEPTSRVLPSSRSNLVQTVALAAVRLADGSAQHVTLLAGVIGACHAALQACHTAAHDAAAQAEHARVAAELAAAAVLSAKKSAGDAAVSAEAQAQANKAGKCVG